MGGASSDEFALAHAYELGRLIATSGWVLLNGGRDAGVMAASAKGAADAGGLVIGVLPGDDWEGVAAGVAVAVITGMGDARNAINVLSSHVVVALKGGAGTLSEVALALKAGRPVVTLDFPLGESCAPYYARGRIVDTSTPDEAMATVRWFLGENGSPVTREDDDAGAKTRRESAYEAGVEPTPGTPPEERAGR